MNDIINAMTLLIRNVKIVGGAGAFPESSDVFVTGDKISAIGNFPAKGADTVLDGQGAYLFPGFIDVNTDSDHYLTLLDYPQQEDFLKQGVTTIFGGMCGSSLAPLLYGSLESMRKWGDIERINVNWHTLAEFLSILDKRPLAVNFATLVGHSTIRRAIIGESLRDLTKNELPVFAEVLKKALREGAFGLSTGLSYIHAQSTPYAELKFLAGVAEEAHGIYATHLRKTGEGIGAAVEEAITLAKETRVATLVSHFVPQIGAEEEYETALQMIESLPPEMQFRFDVYPSESTMLPIYTFLPSWVKTGGMEVMLRSVKDEWLLSKIKKDMPHIEANHFTVAQAPGNDFFVGKSLAEISEMFNMSDERDALLHLMAIVGMRGTIFYKNLDPDLIRRALASKRSFIASNAPSFSDEGSEARLKSERTTSTFTKFISFVTEENIMPLEDAVRKITAEPAQFMGLKGRGEIKEGNFADLVCFKDGRVKFTVVNGVLVEQEANFEGKFPGRALRHGSA